jgi:MFS transporter, AAHS family, 4-hydroxybenzoate transporter
MNSVRIFNVSDIVDNQPLRKFTLVIFFICFAAMLSDGYDLGVVGLAAPGIVKGFGLARSQMAPIFSAALVGMLVGALVAGLFGDRFGRKRGILISCAIICVASFACGLINDFSELLWLRFLAGIGLGGLLPNVTALMAEFLPRKIRGSFTTFAFMGITFGGVLPGLISSQLVAGNWRELFLIGGFIPLFVLPAIHFLLPESLKFLSLNAERSAELRKWLGKLAPEQMVPEDAAFVLNEEKIPRFSVSSLFKDHLLLITPLLWLVFIAIMLVNFFINSWLTLVLRDIGFSGSEAAGTASLYYAGGICGVFLIGPALDYFGPAVLVLYSVLGGVITSFIGLPNTTHQLVHILVFLVGFSILGAQVGMSATAGMLYPTAIRSKGAGFAHSIGRFGAIGGPLLAGVLIAKHASLFILFLVPAIPLSVAAIGFLLITWLWTGRFLGAGFRILKKV